MKWLLLIVLFLLLLLLFIMISKLKIAIHYSHTQDDDSLKVEFKVLFGLIKYKLNVPLIKVDDDSPALVVSNQLESERGERKTEKTTKVTGEDMLKSFQDFKNILEHVVSFHRIVRKFLKKVKVTKLEWHSTLGTGDAAFTGMLTGAVWAAKGSLIGLISHYMLLEDVPRVTVHPHFQMKLSQTVLTCMLQFRIGHAIFAAIKILKFWKGGMPKFKSSSLSGLSPNKTKTV